jgi:hypothetical protein
VETAGSLSQRLDLGLALAAGPLVWRQSDDALDGAGPAATFGLAGLAVVLTAGAALTISRGFSTKADGYILAGLGFSAFVLSVPFVAILVGLRRVRPLSARPGTAAFVRAAAACGLGSCWLLLTRRTELPFALPVSTAIAADLAISAWSLPTTVAALAWARQCFRSWPHAGALFAVLVLAMKGIRGQALAVLFTAYGFGALAFIQLHFLDRMRTRLLGHPAYHELALVDEHRRRSHWLHDDVLSLVAGVQMKLERNQLDIADVSRELTDLDHQLRLRQSEEQIRSGSATLGELLQPYLRHARNMGTTIVEAPARETASIRLKPKDARLAQHVFGVLIPNAVQARSTTLAVRFESTPRRKKLVVDVEDNGGGFDWTDLPAGRGLDGLRLELGANRLRFRRTSDGTCVSVDLYLPTMEAS